MTYAAGAAELVRVNRWVLTLTCDYCTLSNGVGDCTATEQCYYTYPTCKDSANYSKGSKSYVYQHGGPLLAGALPLLTGNLNLLPTKINTEDFKTERGELKIELVDDTAHPLANPDKIGYTAADSGRYWPNWIKRNPNYRGRQASLRRDLLDLDGNLHGSKYFFYGILDDIDYSGKGVTITIKDRLWAAAVAKAPIKTPTNVVLSGNHTDSVTTLTLTDGGASYAASKHFKAATAREPQCVKVEDEYIIYTGVSGATLTGCTRHGYGTTAAAHADAVAVSQVLVYANDDAASWAACTGLPADHCFMDLICNHGGISAAYIATVDSEAALNEGGALSDSDATITLDDAGDFPTAGVIKIEDEYIYHTGKTGNNLTGCKRGMYGTTAAAHDDATAIYLTTWGKEFDIWTPNSLYKNRFESEGAVKDKINSLRASIICDMWVGEDGLIYGRMQTPPLPDYTAATINDDNIIHGSKKFSRNEEARLTRLSVYYDPSAADAKLSGDDADLDYSGGYAYIDADREAANFYNEIRKTDIFAPWIVTSSDAAFIAARRFIKARDGVPQIECAVELKDEPDVGDYVQGTFAEVPAEGGGSEWNYYEVISKTPGPTNRITLLLEDAGFGHHNYGLIGYPNPALDEDLDDSETSIDVDLGTTGWAFADLRGTGVIRCLPDGEKITYTGVTDLGSSKVRFTGCGRGADGTAATTHTTADKVMILYAGAGDTVRRRHVWIGAGDPPMLDSDADHTADADGYYIY